MALRLYNSMGRRTSIFRPLRGRRVGMYTCGPTVWNYAHVGNFRTFVFEDVLRRYLEYRGYEVTHVKNITDVEDRIIRGIKETGMSRVDLTDLYTKAFMEDLSALNVKPAHHYPRATEHVGEMVEAIKSLIGKGYAYTAEDGSVYFSISRFRRYGRLSGVKVQELKEGARVAADHYEKMGAKDFALWKAWDPDDGDVFWETELGKGRPGWHIECSVMSMKYLGKSFDIHTGGKDLRFPHHENEIAQSEALTGRRFVKYWLHSEFLRVNGEEMHKSLGNMVTLRQLLEKAWDPRAVRLFLISAHYRDELNLTDESLSQASSSVSKLDQLARRLKEPYPEGSGRTGGSLGRLLLREFQIGMDDDLKTPRALAALFKFVRRANTHIDSGRCTASDARGMLGALRKADSVLGVMKFEEASISEEARALIREREDARRRRDFPRADEIREELRRQGIIVEDTPSGTAWKKA